MQRRFVGAALGLVVILITTWPDASVAQETGTPIFKAPYRAFDHHELGISFSDPGEAVSFALEGFYRYAQQAYDLSVRGGFEDLEETVNGVDVGGGTRVLLGGDFRAQLINYSESFPVDGALTVGFGANVGDGPDSYFVPVGLSLGRRFTLEGSNTTFVPYAHPVLVPVFGGGSSDVEFALGLGVDVRLSDSFALRASGGIGDIEGLGISAALIR